MGALIMKEFKEVENMVGKKNKLHDNEKQWKDFIKR